MLNTLEEDRKEEVIEKIKEIKQIAKRLEKIKGMKMEEFDLEALDALLEDVNEVNETKAKDENEEINENIDDDSLLSELDDVVNDSSSNDDNTISNIDEIVETDEIKSEKIEDINKEIKQSFKPNRKDIERKFDLEESTLTDDEIELLATPYTQLSKDDVKRQIELELNIIKNPLKYEREIEFEDKTLDFIEAYMEYKKLQKMLSNYWKNTKKEYKENGVAVNECTKNINQNLRKINETGEVDFEKQVDAIFERNGIDDEIHMLNQELKDISESEISKDEIKDALNNL